MDQKPKAQKIGIANSNPTERCKKTAGNPSLIILKSILKECNKNFRLDL